MKIQSTMRSIALALTILVCPATSYSLEPLTTFMVGTGVASLALSIAAWWRSGKSVEQPKKSVRINNGEKPKSVLKQQLQTLSDKVTNLELELRAKPTPASNTDLKKATESTFTETAEQSKADNAKLEESITQIKQELKGLSENTSKETLHLKQTLETKCEELLKKIEATKKTENTSTVKKVITSKAQILDLQNKLKELEKQTGPLATEFANLKSDYVEKEKELDKSLVALQALTHDVDRQLKAQSEKVAKGLEDALKNIRQSQEAFATKEYVAEQGNKFKLEATGIVTGLITDSQKSFLVTMDQRFATKAELKKEIEDTKNWATKTFIPKNQFDNLQGLIGQVLALKEAFDKQTKETTAFMVLAKSDRAQGKRSRSNSPSTRIKETNSSSSQSSSSNGTTYIRDGKPVNVQDSKHSRSSSTSSTSITLPSSSSLSSSTSESTSSSDESSIVLSNIDLNTLNTVVQQALNTNAELLSSSLSSASSNAS